jgi:hypothetical protein
VIFEHFWRSKREVGDSSPDCSFSLALAPLKIALYDVLFKQALKARLKVT